MFVNRRQRATRASARGFSLVELMVGIAVGMFVVAAAALMTSGQLTDNRRLLLETQLQQDLRATADIVAREIRRGGSWDLSRNGVPPPGGGTIVINPYAGLQLGTEVVGYAYRRSSGAESFGFRRTSGGVLQSCQSDFNINGCTGTWQDLTDRSAIEIEQFNIATTRADLRARTANGDATLIPCTSLCADGTTGCWPRVRVREVVISIIARSASDSSIRRSLDLSVRLRNDAVQISNEALLVGSDACPG